MSHSPSSEEDDRYDRDREYRRGRDEQTPWQKLNGHRISIAANAGTLIVLATPLILMYSDLQTMKAQLASMVSASRVAVLEEQMASNLRDRNEKLAELREQMRRYEEENNRRDERSIQDREAMHQRLDRIEGRR
jgi:hypothetical protein